MNEEKKMWKCFSGLRFFLPEIVFKNENRMCDTSATERSVAVLLLLHK